MSGKYPDYLEEGNWLSGWSQKSKKKCVVCGGGVYILFTKLCLKCRGVTTDWLKDYNSDGTKKEQSQ